MCQRERVCACSFTSNVSDERWRIGVCSSESHQEAALIDRLVVQGDDAVDVKFTFFSLCYA